MGEKRRRLRRFFAENPNCCFCAGDLPATTEDHQPGRIFFKNREWPEGFSFPACAQCNSVSRDSERILGVLVHGHAGDEVRDSYLKNLESVRRDYPREINALLTSRIAKRRILKEQGWTMPAGLTLDDLPIVTLRREFWNPHLEMFSRKLMLALHYQCFGLPLSRTGGLWSYIHTNFDFAANQYPDEILDVAKLVAAPVRNRRYLNDQFLVRWNVVENSRTAIFVVQLQNMLAVTGITTEEPNRFGKPETDIERPFGPWKVVY